MYGGKLSVAGQNELMELGAGLRRKFIQKEGLFVEVPPYLSNILLLIQLG